MQGASRDPSTAVGYGQFVAAAYTMYENDPTNLNPPKSADFPAGYDLVSTIQMSDFFGEETTRTFYGFIARSTAPPTTWVVAIRGTESLTEWWDDFHFGFMPFDQVAPGSGRGDVAVGFGTIYETLGLTPAGQQLTAAESRPSASFAADVARVVRGASAQVEAQGAAPVELIATGHSLGAALITLYALDSAVNHALVPAAVYTFASPRVGDATFASCYAANLPLTWRVANSVDIVPYFPPELVGYVHVDTLYGIDSFWSVHFSVGCDHALNTYLHVLEPAQRAAERRLRAAARRRGSAGRSRAGQLTHIVPAGDADFAAMLRGDLVLGGGLRVPPGGVDEPAVLAHVRGIAATLQAQGYTGGQWMVVAGGEVVGLCGFKHAPSPAGQVEIGYGMAAARRGRGHATAAVGALLDVARRDPAVRAVLAQTALDNVASQRVLAKNGFARVGTSHDLEDGELIVWRKALR